MKRKKITKWILLLLFVLLFGIVDFLLKGYCIENAWNIGRKKTTLYDRKNRKLFRCMFALLTKRSYFSMSFQHKTIL